MKTILTRSKFLLVLFIVSVGLHSCLKDTCKQRYMLYSPVYKTKPEVRADIKNSPASEIKNPGKMFVLGSYIFLNEIDKGIHIIDNSNPSSPVNKYFISIPGNMDVAVTGNTLYADLYTDMVTMDISNPASIEVKQITENAFPFRRYSSGFVADNSKIIVDWVGKDTTVSVDCGNGSWGGRADVLTFNLTSSSAPQTGFSAATGVSGSMARFSLLNNYLYTVTDNALNVFNITRPQQPVFSNKVDLNWGIETIYAFKNTLFIGSNSGMFIYGTANPVLPASLGTFSHARRCDPVIADNDYAYVTLRGGTVCGGFTNQLDIVDVRNLSAPSLVKSYPLTNPYGLSKDGNTLVVCDGTDGIKIFDAANVNDVKLLQTIKVPQTYDVITVKGVAIVVAKDGLYQYNYSDPANTKLLSKIAIQ